MKKKLILVALLIMSVGFAALNTTLSINGKTTLYGELDDFDVYYSNALVNGEYNKYVIHGEKLLSFTTDMTYIGDKYTLEYDVTNSSSIYDAQIEMACTSSNEYLSITNHFDTYNNLEAKATRRGKLEVELKKSYSANDNPTITINCELTANAISRDTIVEATPAEPVVVCKWRLTDTDNSGTVTVGDEYMFCTEKFNVIEVSDYEVKMLAKKGLSTDYRQNENGEINEIKFSTKNGWAYTPGPKEIDVQTYDGEVKKYINEYQTYLQTEAETTDITVDLITLKELKNLGCTINEDYSYTSGLTCANSSYANWLIINKEWWTRSADPSDSSKVWSVSKSTLRVDAYNGWIREVRPVITVPKEILGLETPKDPAQAFCENLGYKYGMEYVMTYQGGDDDEYFAGTPYVCSNDEDYAYSCLYQPDGTQMFCQ